MQFATKFNSPFQLSPQLTSDLLASLTTVPFWLNQGGNFQMAFSNKPLNHWEESNQWLVSTGDEVEGNNSGHGPSVHRNMACQVLLLWNLSVAPTRLSALQTLLTVRSAHQLFSVSEQQNRRHFAPRADLPATRVHHYSLQRLQDNAAGGPVATLRKLK